jgi:tmRNA-binding protein
MHRSGVNLQTPVFTHAMLTLHCPELEQKMLFHSRQMHQEHCVQGGSERIIVAGKLHSSKLNFKIKLDVTRIV